MSSFVRFVVPIVGAVFVLGGCGTPPSVVRTGAIMCDPAVASASNDGRQGVAGNVNVAGPAVVGITVVGNGRTRHGQQQVTGHDSGASFDFPLTAPADSITVTVRAQNHVSSCVVTPPVYPNGSRANGVGN
jgi:hypothetical protein